MTELHHDDGDDSLDRLYQLRAQNQAQRLVLEEMIAEAEGIPAEELVHRRRRRMRGLALIPGIGGGAALIRRWPHVASAVGGAVAAGGAVAIALAPQIGNGGDRPDAAAGRPPVAAPPSVSALPHPRPSKTSPPPSGKPPVSPPAATPPPPIPTPGPSLGQGRGQGDGPPTKPVKPVKPHGKPTSRPGKPTAPPGKPRPFTPSTCLGGIPNLLGLLCGRWVI